MLILGDSKVIQGSAADMMKCAMLEIRSRLQECGMLERKDAMIILQIHDEIGMACCFRVLSPQVTS